MLRRARGDVDALLHPDLELPTFPASRALTESLIGELSWLPPEETDFECLVRVLAVGESSRDFARPTLAHIRPFAHSFFLMRSWPVATRTILGRYDGITTMWSFRGRELDDRGVDVRGLASSLILQTSTWASSRAYGRILGFQGALAEPLAQALALKPERGPEHPAEVSKIAELRGLSLEEAAERLGKATRARRPNADRVVEAISTHEYIVSRLSADPSQLADWTPIEPEWSGGEDAAVRRHFMYWRTWCRSVIPRAHDTYSAFIERVLPELASLPWKLENEALALLRNWSGRASREALESVIAPLEARFEAIIEDDGATRDERLLAILSVFAAHSFEKWEAGVRALLDHPGFDDAEWNRILELPRQNDSADALLASSVFRELHGALSQGESAGIASGRVEWVRQATLRGKRGARTRWLLHRDAWPEIVFSSEFVSWFATRGLSLLEEGDAAVDELLQLALLKMSAENVDIAANYLLSSPEHSVEQLADLLLDSSNALAACVLLTSSSSQDGERIARALQAGLAQAKGMEDLARLAQLVAAARTGGVALDSSLLEALASRLQAHEIPRGDRHLLGRQLEAWRLARVPLEGESAEALLRSAVYCLADTSDQECRRFIAWAVERAILRECGDDLVAMIRMPASQELFYSSLDDFTWPASYAAIFRSLRDLPRRSPALAAVRSALHAGEESAQLESLVDGEVLARATYDLDATRNHLEALRNLLQCDLEAVDEDDDDLTSEAHEAQDDLRDEEAGDVADADDADDDADSDAAGDEPAEAKSARSKRARPPFSQVLAERARRGIVERLIASLNFWVSALGDAQQEDVAFLPARLVQALAAHDPRRLSLREDLLTRVVREGRARGLRLDDPRNVIANPIVRAWAELSPAALEAASAWLADMQARNEAASKITITRDGASLLIQNLNEAAPAEDLDEAADELTADGTPDELSSDDAPAGDASSDDTDAAESDDDAASDGDDSARKQELPLLVRAWRNEAGADGGREAFGSALSAPLMRRLLRRNAEFTLSFQAKDGRVDASLRWGRPRRQGGRRR